MFTGTVNEIREANTKRNGIMAFITVEDLKGKISLIAFPDVYRKTRDLFLGDALLLIRGRLDKSEMR